jgi:hypothetical protein
MRAKARSKAGRKGRPDNRAGQESRARAATKKKSAEKKSAPAIGRDASGKFIKGFSGNVHGQPIVQKEIRELARQHGPEAIERLVLWMRSTDPQASIMAAKIILDRGFGKPAQPLTTPNGAPLVSLNFGAPITTAEEAARVYAELCRDPGLDVSGLKFSAPEPALIEQNPNTKDIQNAK